MGVPGWSSDIKTLKMVMSMRAIIKKTERSIKTTPMNASIPEANPARMPTASPMKSADKSIAPIIP